MAVTALLSVGDGLSADYLDLMDSAKHAILPGGADFSEPGRILLSLIVKGTTADAMATNYQAIQTKLRQAEIAVREGNTSERVTFGWQYSTTNMLYYDVLSGTLSPLGILKVQTHAFVTLELRCLPWARGVSITDTVTATLTNGVAQWLRADVPGDYPALCKFSITDVSTTATIVNRIRMARRSATSAVLGDFDPWVDAGILAPGTNTVDATAFGGGYSAYTQSTTTMANVARATMPAGALNKGRYDLWARVYGSGTAMNSPTSLTATVTAPTSTTTTETTTTTDTIELVQSAEARVTAGTTVAPTWTTATTVGNLLLAVVLEQQNDAAITAPGGWTLVKTQALTSEAGNEIVAFVYAIKASASRSGAETFSALLAATAADPNAAVLMEFSGVYGGTSNAYVNVQGAGSTADSATFATGTYSSVFAGGALLTVVATAGNATAAQLDYVNAGYYDLYDTNQITVGFRRTPSVGESIAPTFTFLATEVAMLYVTLILRPSMTTVTNTTTTYATPLPGALAVGTYAFRVQAVDPVGTLSAPTGTVNGVVAAANSKIALAWVAPASGTVSYYKVTYSFDGRFYTFYTTDATASATVTTITDHAETTALPSAGDAAPMPRVRARVGTSGSLTAILSDLPERTISGASATWHHMKLASAVDLPPVGEHLGGTRPEWAVEVQMRSANGLSATARVDALWLAPHDEAQATLEYPGLTLATLRRWVAETDRAGRHMTGWLEDTGTSAESGRLTCAGAMTLSPGDNIIALLIEKAAGVSDLVDSKVTVVVTVFPRYSWLRGLP